MSARGDFVPSPPFKEWHAKNARASKLLDYARLRRKEQAGV